MKNKISLLVIYTRNKSIADMQNDEQENRKMAFKIIKLIFGD
jgi:hypothetical protein